MNPLTSENRYDSAMATIYAFEWDYDGVGNRTYQYRDGTETYYSHNEANELRHFVEGGASTYFQYDARGNCTVIEKPSGATYFEYSDADLVTSIQFASGVTNYFYYDGKLRRYAMEDSKGLTYFVWDQNGMNLLAEFDAYGNTIAEYTHGHAEIDGVGSMVERKLTDRTDPMNPVTYYRYDSYDTRGTPFGTTDENGNRVGTFDYNAFGDRLQATEVGPACRIGYQSNWITLPDSNGEIIITPTRPYYTPTGRFLQEDPLTKPVLLASAHDFRPHRRAQELLYRTPPALLEDTINLYVYVGNEVLTSVDPNGCSKGGQKNIVPSGVPPNISLSDLDDMIEAAESNPKTSKKHLEALKSYRKVRKTAQKYADKYGKKTPKGKGAKGGAGKGLKCLLIIDLIRGVLEDLSLMKRALDSGRSLEEQMRYEYQDAGPILFTPFGPIPNPFAPGSGGGRPRYEDDYPRIRDELL